MSLEGYEELARLAEKTRIFLYNLIGSVSFFVYGGFFAGYWLLVASTPVTGWGWIVVAIVAIVLGMLLGILLYSLPWPRMGSSGRLKYIGVRWIISFTLPFIVAYNVLTIFIPSENIGLLVDVLWYPSLSIALLLAHLLVMRPLDKLNPGLIRSKPFLVAGGITLATSPLVLYSPWIIGVSKAWILALGLMVLSYSITGLHSLYVALKVFEE